MDSDFLVIDERLAKHYGIEGVKGRRVPKVAIRPEHRRGGVLGMAGVLTYLTDGLRTLPVRRAAYVLETLWNAPPPRRRPTPATCRRSARCGPSGNGSNSIAIRTVAPAATPRSIRSAWRWRTTMRSAPGASARTASASRATTSRRRWT